MKLFGLIGYPLGHSFSKSYFTKKFEDLGLKDHRYDLFEIEKIEDFPGIWDRHPELLGMNVTVPYKLEVKKYLDELDESASKVGAVNVIRKKGDRLIGYNSDYFGFKQSLRNFLRDKKVEKSLILGTGGASKAVKAVLEDLRIVSLFVSRNKGQGVVTYEELKGLNIEDYPLIVNTTPLGMHPNITSAPDLPYDSIASSHFLFDLVYNPETTKFMELGMNRGASVINGLEMLHLQADKSWEIWNK